jgi:hypothetical protein
MSSPHPVLAVGCLSRCKADICEHTNCTGAGAITIFFGSLPSRSADERKNPGAGRAPPGVREPEDSKLTGDHAPIHPRYGPGEARHSRTNAVERRDTAMPRSSGQQDQRRANRRTGGVSGEIFQGTGADIQESALVNLLAANRRS